MGVIVLTDSNCLPGSMIYMTTSYWDDPVSNLLNSEWNVNKFCISEI